MPVAMGPAAQYPGRAAATGWIVDSIGFSLNQRWRNRAFREGRNQAERSISSCGVRDRIRQERLSQGEAQGSMVAGGAGEPLAGAQYGEKRDPESVVERRGAARITLQKAWSEEPI